MSLPVTLRLAGRTVLIAGAGPVALRKACALREAGAHLRIAAPAFDAHAKETLRALGAELREHPYEPADLDGVFLAVAATADDAVNAQIVADAAARGVLSSDATGTDRGDVAMSASVRVGDLTFGIDTGGAAPAFARRVASEVRDRFDDGYGRAAQTLARMRTYVKTVVPKAERGAVLRALAQLPIERLAAMNAVEAEHETEAAIRQLRGEESLPTATLVCASRGSALALVQTRAIAATIAQHGLATEILTVSTTGDRVQDRSLTAIGAESLFVKELELALRDGRAQYAVHSCKDLPSTLPTDMRIAAIARREDPRDVFCSERFADFAALPAGARVGTSSLRRRAQLRALRPDLDYADVRGNVDTRLRKVREGSYDAVVLAAAGLARLGAHATYTVPFAVDEIVPAVAQGALAVEVRADAETLAQRLREIVNDATSERCVRCERAALRALRGGCQAPIGVYARYEGRELVVDGVVISSDGRQRIAERRSRRAESLQEAEALGEALAEALSARGAAEILERSQQPAELPLAGRLIILPRTQDRPSAIAAALRADGADVVEIRRGTGAQPDRAPDAIVFASSGSVAAAHALLERLRDEDRRPAVAAMGPATTAAAQAAGFPPQIVAPEAGIDALVGAVRALLAREVQS